MNSVGNLLYQNAKRVTIKLITSCLIFITNVCNEIFQINYEEFVKMMTA